MGATLTATDKEPISRLRHFCHSHALISPLAMANGFQLASSFCYFPEQIYFSTIDLAN